MKEYKIYTKSGYCGYCDAAKVLMREKNIRFKEVKLVTVEQKQFFRDEGFSTVPQIYDDEGNHIGGYDDLRKKLNGNAL